MHHSFLRAYKDGSQDKKKSKQPLKCRVFKIYGHGIIQRISRITAVSKSFHDWYEYWTLFFTFWVSSPICSPQYSKDRSLHSKQWLSPPHPQKVLHLNLQEHSHVLLTYHHWHTIIGVKDNIIRSLWPFSMFPILLLVCVEIEKCKKHRCRHIFGWI